MRIGVHIANVTWPGGASEIASTLAAVTRTAEQVGCEHVSVMDHWFQMDQMFPVDMWSGENGPYEGRHYRLAETLCVPQPLSRPHPPIWIGGGGEKKLLRLVARYADASNLIATDLDQVAHKLDVLREHCDDLDRNPDEIDKTILYVGDALNKGDTDRFLAEMSHYAKLGISTVVVMPLDNEPVAFVERLGTSVIPTLSGL